MKSMKFGRKRDQRRALIKSLADSLVMQESIEATLPKAKAVARYTEKLISKAKTGQTSLHNRRLVISRLATKTAAHKLVDEIAPKLSARNSGYLRVERTGMRAGDGAPLAKVSFVDDLKGEKKSQKKEEPKRDKGLEKEVEAEEQKQAAPAPKDTSSKISQPKVAPQVTKRSGVRGNR